MNDQLKPLLDLLTGKLPFLPSLFTWIGALNVAFLFIGAAISKWAAGLLVKIVDSPDPDDDHFLLAILDNSFYRFACFFLGVISLPLPTRADYNAALLKKNAANGITTPVSAIVSLFLALSLLGGLCLFDVGCKSPPGRIAYNVAAGTQISVELAMAEWNVYVGAKHPPLTDELKVQAAYEEYQKAMSAVCDAGEIYAASTMTNSVGNTGFKAALDQAKAEEAQALTDLMNLITSLGVTLH